MAFYCHRKNFTLTPASQKLKWSWDLSPDWHHVTLNLEWYLTNYNVINFFLSLHHLHQTSFISGNIRSILETLVAAMATNSGPRQATISEPTMVSSDLSSRRGKAGLPMTSRIPIWNFKELLAQGAKFFSPVGYDCSSSKLTLAETSQPVAVSGQPLAYPVVHDLIIIDISLTKDRIDNITHLINLASLFKPLTNLMSSSVIKFVQRYDGYKSRCKP